MVSVDGAAPGGIDMLSTVLERAVNASGEPIALVVDFASRLDDRVSPDETHLQLTCRLAAFSAKTLIWHDARPINGLAE